MRKNISKTILCLLLAFFVAHPNHILNGDFDANTLPDQNQKTISFMFPVSHWSGVFATVGSSFVGAMGSGQNCDTVMLSNGYLEQNVTLPADDEYVLAWKQKARTTDFPSYKIQIYWNGSLKKTSEATTTDVVQSHIIFKANAGTSLLKIVEIGEDYDATGMNIDELCLETVIEGGCSVITSSANNSGPAPENQEAKQEKNELVNGISNLNTLPISQLKGLKYLGIFIDDMWLYAYDSRSYNGTLQQIFKAGNEIQKLKWTLFNFLELISIDPKKFAFSNYQEFSNKKHMEIDGVDDVFVRKIYSFLFFTIPQMLMLCGILKGIFLLLFNYKISVFFRRYSFVFPSSVQMLLEGNVAYFTFIAFNQMKVAFSFKFIDKLSIVVCVCFFGLLFIGSICFYVICNQYYQKQFGYFLYCVFRCNSALCFLTIKFLIRGILRGAIHHFFFFQYGVEILLLCVVDTLIVLLGIVLEKMNTIFLTKTMFWAIILYHTNFVLINVSLYVEEYSKQKEDEETQLILLQVQEVLIFVQVFLVALLCLLDILPLEWFSHPEEEDDDEIEIIINRVEENEHESSVQKSPQQSSKTVQVEDVTSIESESLESAISRFKLPSRKLPKEKNTAPKSLKRV